MAAAPGHSKTGGYGADPNTKEFLNAFKEKYPAAGNQLACYIDIDIVLHRSKQASGILTMKKKEETGPGTEADKKRMRMVDAWKKQAINKIKTIYEMYLSSTEKQNSLVGVRETSRRAGDREDEVNQAIVKIGETPWKTAEFDWPLDRDNPWTTLQSGILKRFAQKVLEFAAGYKGSPEYEATKDVEDGKVIEYGSTVLNDLLLKKAKAFEARSGYYNQLDAFDDSFRYQYDDIDSAHSFPFDDHNHYQPLISEKYNDVSGSGSPLLIGGVVGASAVVIIMLIFCLGLA
eukprot:773249_1